MVKSNEVALKTGYNFAETTEVFTTHFTVKKAVIAPGRYRKITGNEATAIGFVTAAKLAGRPLFYGSYPITPASDILHDLARHKNYGVKTFQAEDEIAAVCAAIGASFAGHIGLTGTSGPGVALKQEAIGLAVMTELPLVIINVQRGGPSVADQPLAGIVPRGAPRLPAILALDPGAQPRSGVSQPWLIVPEPTARKPSCCKSLPAPSMERAAKT